MRMLVTGKQMKAIDAYTIHTIGIPSLVLMERAALEVAAQVKALAAELWGEGGPGFPVFKNPGPRIWAVCGPGNNGADGVAAARMLHLEGYQAEILTVGNPEHQSQECRIQLSIARKVGVLERMWQEALGEGCDILIDAVFGVGLSRPVEGGYRECLDMLARAGDFKVVAVDMPSGIHSDTGAVMGTALKAHVTVTFGWEKAGILLYPGRGYAGRVVVADIGFPSRTPWEAGEDDSREAGYIFTCGPEDLKRIPGRRAYSNKGTFGKVLIVAGSRNMCGAAYLSALAAYRTGAGLVRLLTVEDNREILQQRLPEAVIATYAPNQLMEGRAEFKKMIEEQTGWADVVVLGPGLGREPYVEYLVEDILTSAYVPVIIDADGLNAIAAHPYLTSYYTENITVTPHLGEMARLTGDTVAEIRENLPAAARAYADRYGVTCVLKDAATVVAGKEAGYYINSSGNSSMAKAGSGDVLTGIIAGLTAIGMEGEEAAVLGVYLHGRAGDEAVKAKGIHSLLASDLADCIGKAMHPKEAGVLE